MTSIELAEAVQFDNPELIGRLLRCLVAKGIVTTNNGWVFCSTLYLAACISTSGDKWKDRYNEFVAAMTTLPEYFSTHERRDIMDPMHTVHS